MSPRHCTTASPCHCVSQSFALPPATKPVSHLPCPLPLNQSVIWLAPCHQTSQSFDLPSTTVSPHHRVTVSLCQSVICLAPCHQTSQSFALPPATKPVSHLPCPLPPNQPVIWLALYHHITTSLHQCTTTSPHHHVSQSFALPPATKPVSHLTCPLPLHHHITASPCHRITASLHQIFPTTWVWIWLVNANQHSSDWLIVPTTANQITGIEKPNYHKTLIFFPTTSLKWSHEARIDELAYSNEPAIIQDREKFFQVILELWVELSGHARSAHRIFAAIAQAITFSEIDDTLRKTKPQEGNESLFVECWIRSFPFSCDISPPQKC